MKIKRVRKFKNDAQHTTPGAIIYWMSRDQRIKDNWALYYAQTLALKYQVPLGIVFSLSPQFLGATIRQYDFMLKGLEALETTLSEYEVPFFLLLGEPTDTIEAFVQKNKVSALVTDFSPLKMQRHWKKHLFPTLEIPIYEVDTHNIVPIWEASEKQEYAAYTIRPKIHKRLAYYLDELKQIVPHLYSWPTTTHKTDWKGVYETLEVDEKVLPLDWLVPGEQAAKEVLEDFIDNKLDVYDKYRNDPNKQVTSNLSPYFHFGQLSPQRVALAVQASNASGDNKEAFLEELIVRRELADNFCYYNSNYDNFLGFPRWAQASLKAHREDPREFIYSKDDFEKGQTHDPLWNKTQEDLVNKGKIHGYLRMYWAKKILEWSRSPEDAMHISIYLNDKYAIDGRDPNGYVGIAWSIGGVHDRAWFNRNIYGKVRYMNFNGCKSKFDVDAYINNGTLV
ncbi:deoxyribodipyrimidine photo-lyase [Serpentinicella sp. ANB-PHB4]|uniref:deoxyribodipyrimidine photo-lyase n=1 Tax=Serpentinicella sp. ANB-PHB4 TaxID=3074076 RepID=UPI0028647C0B|nr:deoxyribodipyrimidine photo-lyase [Serpentinicella sp. ANB-PHB4]MDR5658478.1 deoxyribodipyrimidine photo-lyase [Serpentinicella sp. ANB-PHB4]